MRIPTTTSGSQSLGPRTDPDSVDSDVAPSDFSSIAPPLSEEDERIVGLIESRAKEASVNQRPYLGRGMESLAFYNGDQYGYYNTAKGTLDDSRDLTNQDRVYSSNNKLRPVVAHLTARAMAGEVAAVFRPKTGRPDDVAGTRQMRAVWAHVLKVNDWDSLHVRLIENSIIVNPPCCQVTYNKDTWIEIPEFVPGTDPTNPEIADVHDVQKGEIQLDFVAFDELLIDPKARLRYEADWMMFEKRRSLSYIRTKWPEQGKWVEGDPQPTTAEVLRDGATLNYTNRSGKSASKTAMVRTLWELPTGIDDDSLTEKNASNGLYPKGRYIVVAGGRVLESTDYPYPEMARKRLFPFCCLPYRNGIETVWGDNALFPLLNPQRNYNRAINKIQEHAKRGDGKLVAERGAEVDAKAFRSEARDEVIMYTRVDPRNPSIIHDKPEYIELAPLDPVIELSLQISDNDIKAISSVNDPTLGNSKGDLSGIAINALQDGDQSEGQLFKDNDRRMVQEVATLVGILAKQFYLKDEARLLYVQDTAPLNQPSPVFPQPSPQPSPQGPPQAQGPQAPVPPQGMAGQPGAPPAPAPATSPPPDPSDAADSPVMQAMIFDKIGMGRWTVETTAEASMSASAKRQMLMQLMQGGAFTPQQMPATMVLLREFGLLSSDETMDDLKSALQLMMQMEAPPPGPPPPPPAPDPLQMLQIQSHLDSMSERLKIQEQSAAAIALVQAKAQYPTVALAGKLTPAGEISAEEMVGLDVHGAANHAAAVSAVAPDVAHHYGAGPTPTVQAQQANHQANIDAAQAEQQHANTIEQSSVAHQQSLEQGDAQAQNSAALQDQQAQATTEQMKTQAALTPKPAGKGE